MASAAGPKQRRAVRATDIDASSARGLLIRHLCRLSDGIAHESERLTSRQPGAVHRLRVHSRRYRSALRTFAPVMRTEELADARADLAWIASTLSRLRDLEVVENRIQHLASRSTHAGSVDDATAAPTSVEQAAAWVVPQLQGEREQAWTEALDEIGGEQWRDALERLARLANDPPTRHRADRPADTVLPRLVGRQYAALSTRAASVRADGDDADWHRVRITAKHARNAAELAVPVVGSDARRLAKRLNTITDLLGELQDTVLVRGTLMGAAHGAARSDAGPDVDPVAAGFGLGLLHAQEVQAATRLRTAFPAAWAEADRKRYRRWLGA